MKVYIVSYELGKNRSHIGLFEQLKAQPSWWHYLDCTWLIATADDADHLVDRLKPHLDQEDRLLVIQAGADRQGWLPEKAWDWIRQALGPK